MTPLPPETPDERARNRAQAERALASARKWCANCNALNPGVGEAIRIAPAIWVCSEACRDDLNRYGPRATA